jgi:hypothetical protein
MANQKNGKQFYNVLRTCIYYLACRGAMGFNINFPFLKSRLLRISQAPLSVLRASAFDPSTVRAISLDITGTILVHRYPIMQTYADAAVWARLPNPPSAEELKPGTLSCDSLIHELDTEQDAAFKQAYFKQLTESPCFGFQEELSGRYTISLLFALGSQPAMTAIRSGNGGCELSAVL